MLENESDFIIVIVEFEYDSKGPTRQVLGELRLTFLGFPKGYPRIPQKMRKFMQLKEEIIFPIPFALIKKPIRI